MKEIDNRWKGVLLMNIYCFTISLTFLAGKYIFVRNPQIHPQQMLFLRGFLACIILIIGVNKDLKYAVYDNVKRDQFKGLIMRATQASMVVLINFTIVEYVSLVF